MSDRRIVILTLDPFSCTSPAFCHVIGDQKPARSPNEKTEAILSGLLKEMVRSFGTEKDILQPLRTVKRFLHGLSAGSLTGLLKGLNLALILTLTLSSL